MSRFPYVELSFSEVAALFNLTPHQLTCAYARGALPKPIDYDMAGHPVWSEAVLIPYVRDRYGLVPADIKGFAQLQVGRLEWDQKNGGVA
ncbi:hypothetical protein CEY09_05340 [Achromobacter marplatensis]|uniref:Pyocin activator protein PrtN n=1 Tax=Achromobacter marplatensis TaxID=470868 RepID=A0ABX9GH85_9BURK|nr:hypothetical protein [Achromobacter marplatensis]OWT70994.1 hypothetical protein CEY09_05340 [Achromobacter marplatensis]RBP22613.1 hypothetical protein DFP87_102355 [Achromobacter marplatensis]CAB3648658.1 hypothetical protein LMG26219_02637 [Achromobacter marplatensis]